MKTKEVRLNIGSFDLIKGIAMILVILLHILNNDGYDIAKLYFLRLPLKWIRLTGFIMPMFFIISGFGFRKKKPEKMLRKTVSELLIPYSVVALVIVLIYPIAFYLYQKNWNSAICEMIGYGLAYVLGIPEYGKSVFGLEIKWIATIWYLLALFFTFNLLNLILRIQSRIIQIVSVISCVIIGYGLAIYDVNYFCIPQALLGLGYAYIGYLMREYHMLEHNLYSAWVYLILFPVVAIFTRCGKFNMAPGEIGSLLDYAGAGCAAVLVIFLGVCLDRFAWKPLEYIKQVGIYNYWILCIHSVEIGLPQWSLFANRFPNHQQGAFLLAVMLKTILISSMCVVLKGLYKYRYRRRVKKYG